VRRAMGRGEAGEDAAEEQAGEGGMEVDGVSGMEDVTVLFLALHWAYALSCCAQLMAERC
jgi:hypothetical protein